MDFVQINNYIYCSEAKILPNFCFNITISVECSSIIHITNFNILSVCHSTNDMLNKPDRIEYPSVQIYYKKL